MSYKMMVHVILSYPPGLEVYTNPPSSPVSIFVVYLHTDIPWEYHHCNPSHYWARPFLPQEVGYGGSGGGDWV